ncbi:MAG: hypothetical protein ACK484_14880 [Sphingobacteriales bacterium]|jgi:hypothetical protein
MRHIIVVIMTGFFLMSAGIKDSKKDTCKVAVKTKQDSSQKKVVRKRPLYQALFMI